MSVKIASVVPGSPADKAGVKDGDILISLNGNIIEDVLDYRFYMIERKITAVFSRNEVIFDKTIKKRDEYDDLGLEFETYLMDKQRSCRNKCIFCFIDQLPKGLRESLYFKDDDSRLSFLFGNYITLTNLTEHEVERIIKMHISPVNISVHTTNKQLRCRMMNNRFAGDSLEYLYRFAQNGIKLNCQLVLCPGFNDGDELVNTMEKLGSLYPAVQSVAAVPVGLSKHREGLEPLVPFNKDTASAVIDAMVKMGDEFKKKHSTRLFYPSDEFFLLAERELPDCEFYEDFVQLENGVGMYTLTRSQFYEALDDYDQTETSSNSERLAIVTGRAAYGLICELVDAAKKKFPKLNCSVYAIRNDLFGESITVTGLVTGGDIIKQLRGKLNCDRIIIPSSMLDSSGTMFLDDTTPEDIQKELGVPVSISDCSGFSLMDTLLGIK